MKLFLLQSTASYLIATSAVHAYEETSTALRGSDVMVALQASCSDGWDAGTKDVKRIWKASGYDCYGVWGLQGEADDLKEEKYSDSSNWSKASYNECAQDAIDSEVKKIEKKCLEDDSSQCSALGYDAAEQVVRKHWCKPDGSDTWGASDVPDYKANCKAAATSICEGQISNVARRWCHKKNMSPSKLVWLQDKCEKQVDSMVPGEEFFM